MSTGKRLRFEVFKRDGFRCVYCGATPLTSVLHADHVVPVSEGGSDAPENLVTSCADCNLGKSNVSLDESRIETGVSAEDLRDRAAQVRSYMEAMLEVEASKRAVAETVASSYRRIVEVDPPKAAFQRFEGLLEQHGYDRLLEAFAAVARWRAKGNSDPTAEVKYLHGVLRNMRNGQ